MRLQPERAHQTTTHPGMEAARDTELTSSAAEIKPSPQQGVGSGVSRVNPIMHSIRILLPINRSLREPMTGQICLSRQTRTSMFLRIKKQGYIIHYPKLPTLQVRYRQLPKRVLHNPAKKEAQNASGKYPEKIVRFTVHDTVGACPRRSGRGVRRDSAGRYTGPLSKGTQPRRNTFIFKSNSMENHGVRKKEAT